MHKLSQYELFKINVSFVFSLEDKKAAHMQNFKSDTCIHIFFKIQKFQNSVLLLF